MSKKKKKLQKKKEAPEEETAEHDPKTPFINQSWELFCVLFAGVGTRHYFNNAQNSYIEAYGHTAEISNLERDLVLEQNQKLRKKWSQRKKSIELSCRTAASRLLTNVNIQARIGYFLDQHIQHNIVDRELAKAILQDFDLPSKVNAIKEYNRVRDRVKEAGVVNNNVIYSWLGDEKKNAKSPTSTK